MSQSTVGLKAKLEPELDDRQTEKEVKSLDDRLSEATEQALSGDISGLKKNLTEGITEAIQDADIGPLGGQSSPSASPGSSSSLGDADFSGTAGNLKAMGETAGKAKNFGSKMMKGGKGAAGGSAGKAAGGAASGGAMKKALGAGGKLLKVGLAGAVGFGILKGVQKMTDASPYLQKVFGMFSTAMKLFFRPFGRFLADQLRPWAKGAIDMAVGFNNIVEEDGLLVGISWLAETIGGGAIDSVSSSVGNIASGDIKATDLFKVGTVTLAASVFYTINPVAFAATAIFAIDQKMDLSPSNIISLGQDTFHGAVELGQWLFYGGIDLGQWIFNGSIALGQWLFDEATSISWSDIVWTGSVLWSAIIWSGDIAWSAITWTGNIAWDFITWTGSIGWDFIKWSGTIAWDFIKWSGTIGWDFIEWSGNILWGAISWGGNLMWSAIEWAGSIHPSNIIDGSIDIADYVYGSITGGASRGEDDGFVPRWVDPRDEGGIEFPYGAEGGYVGETGAAVIHKGEFIGDRERLVDELANAISASSGPSASPSGAGRARDEDIVDTLEEIKRELQRLDPNVTLEMDSKTVAEKSQKSQETYNDSRLVTR